MGYICDFCGDQRSMVYCRSDAACLCLSCDRNVHSANALSRRHSRTLLCERCNSQPALVRCTEERVSLCQNCDWMGHGTSTSASAHKRQTLNCYSGCPSASELSSIWSFVLDLPAAGESACEQEMGLMSIAENSTGSAWSPPESNTKQNASGTVEVNGVRSVDKSSVLVGSSSVPELNPATHVVGQQGGSENATLPKVIISLKIIILMQHWLKKKIYSLNLCVICSKFDSVFINDLYFMLLIYSYSVMGPKVLQSLKMMTFMMISIWMKWI